MRNGRANIEEILVQLLLLSCQIYDITMYVKFTFSYIHVYKYYDHVHGDK